MAIIATKATKKCFVWTYEISKEKTFSFHFIFSYIFCVFWFNVTMKYIDFLWLPLVYLLPYMPLAAHRAVHSEYMYGRRLDGVWCMHENTLNFGGRIESFRTSSVLFFFPHSSFSCYFFRVFFISFFVFVECILYHYSGVFDASYSIFLFVVIVVWRLIQYIRARESVIRLNEKW